MLKSLRSIFRYHLHCYASPRISRLPSHQPLNLLCYLENLTQPSSSMRDLPMLFSTRGVSSLLDFLLELSSLHVPQQKSQSTFR